MWQDFPSLQGGKQPESTPSESGNSSVESTSGDAFALQVALNTIDRCVDAEPRLRLTQPLRSPSWGRGVRSLEVQATDASVHGRSPLKNFFQQRQAQESARMEHAAEALRQLLATKSC